MGWRRGGHLQPTQGNLVGCRIDALSGCAFLDPGAQLVFDVRSRSALVRNLLNLVPDSLLRRQLAASREPGQLRRLAGPGQQARRKRGGCGGALWTLQAALFVGARPP